jgi:hypothetical protein
LSKFNKDGKIKETIINRIQLLTADVPTSFRKFEIDYSAIKNGNRNSAENQTLPGRTPPGGAGSYAERQIPQLGHLQVGRQAMHDNRIVMTSHLQVGRKALEEPEALELVIKTNPVKITYWPRS